MKSIVMVNSINNATVSVIMDGETLEEVSMQLQILGGNPDKRRHLPCKNPYTDSRRRSSDGQTNKGMEE